MHAQSITGVYVCYKRRNRVREFVCGICVTCTSPLLAQSRRHPPVAPAPARRSFSLLTQTSAAAIIMQQIPDQVAHRLCSGQVISSPADAVKELIDNSLDSGANIIQISLSGGGLQTIEVTDNGSGIQEQDFDQLCLKYTTSKLCSFDELRTLHTLGFRGEALSSLCSLCTSVRLVTKFKDYDVGFILEYNESGQMTKKIRHPRPAGTTVILRGLFDRLAVRRKFFAKDQSIVNKIMNLVMDYALALPHVKFLLSDCHNSVKKDLLTLPNASSLKDRIAVVLKPKPVFEILTLASDILPEVAEEFGVKLNQNTAHIIGQIEMDAAISKAGYGRSNNERQFFSVNGRPVQFPKLGKIINQTFRSYDPTGSGNQYPFFAINLTIPSQMVDINVTPDKRTVLVSNETFLYALIKSSVIQLFGQDPVSLQQSKYTESCSQITIVSEDRETSFGDQSMVSDVTLSSIAPLDTSGSRRITEFFNATPRPSAQTPATNADIGNNDSGRRQIANSFRDPQIYQSESIIPVHLSDGDNRFPQFQSARSAINSVPNTLPRVNAFDEGDISDLLRQRRSRSGSAEYGDENQVRRRHSSSPAEDERGGGRRVSGNKRVRCSTPSSDSPPTFRVPSDVSFISRRARSGEPAPIRSCDRVLSDKTPTSSSSSHRHDDEGEGVTVIEPSPIPKRPSFRISIDVGDISRSAAPPPEIACSQGSQHFQLDLESAANETEAIDEMQRLLKKSDFKEMKIIGQFNRSFIVTQLKKDLLIVDQHASDERRNFDDLLENYELQPQMLISPEKLELTMYQEVFLRLNRQKMEKNGFRFTIDDGAEAGTRYSLIAAPSSGDKLLTRNDVYELLDAIIAAPCAQNIRSSKIVEILAMKACKKSIKINDSLTMEQMRRVIDRMSETSSPWTCAHGRPTVRFLSRIGREKAPAVLPEVGSSQDENDPHS